MNILVINGSPKGKSSNTYRLTSAFVVGLESATACNVKTIETRSLSVAPCRGCFACWNKTPGQCVIHDDMAQVIEGMLWADVTIWSFPLYYFGLPGPLKDLMDRQLPMNLPFMAAETESGGHPSRHDMEGKRTVLISTCGFYTAAGNYDGVEATFDHLCGAGNYEKIFCGQGELFRVKELSVRTDAYLDVVRQAGVEYASTGISAGTRSKLQEPLYPREAFEAMADASWGISQDGAQKEDDSLAFTRQMAALYNKASWDGRERVLQMNYTDVGHVYSIVLGQDGSRVTEEELEFTTRINTPLSVWKSIAVGEISGTDAMMRHLYAVEGDFDLMVHWDDYFGVAGTSVADSAAAGGGSAGAGAQASSKTSWLALLLPWTVFWSAASMSTLWGSLATIAACAALPVVLRGSRRTIFDTLSSGVATLCAAALLAGVGDVVVLAASYVAFGALWLGSCFTRVPLTAHYSMNSYGGEKAWQNAVFIRTNLILTAAWGVLYLLQGSGAFVLAGMGATGGIALMSWLVPAVMGVFTAWFQKWYPARIARG